MRNGRKYELDRRGLNAAQPHVRTDDVPVELTRKERLERLTVAIHVFVRPHPLEARQLHEERVCKLVDGHDAPGAVPTCADAFQNRHPLQMVPLPLFEQETRPHVVILCQLLACKLDIGCSRIQCHRWEQKFVNVVLEHRGLKDEHVCADAQQDEVVACLVGQMMKVHVACNCMVWVILEHLGQLMQVAAFDVDEVVVVLHSVTGVAKEIVNVPRRCAAFGPVQHIHTLLHKEMVYYVVEIQHVPSTSQNHGTQSTAT